MDFKIYVAPLHKAFLFLKTKEKSAFIETIYGFGKDGGLFCFALKAHSPIERVPPPHPLPTRVGGPAGASIRNADVYRWREGGCQVQDMGCRDPKGLNFRKERRETKSLRSKLMSVH